MKIHLDLAPDVQIEFGIGTECVTFGPGAYAAGFSPETPADWESRILDQARRPFLATIWRNGLILSEWTLYAMDLEQARVEGLTAAQPYGDDATITVRPLTRAEGWV